MCKAITLVTRWSPCARTWTHERGAVRASWRWVFYTRLARGIRLLTGSAVVAAARGTGTSLRWLRVWLLGIGGAGTATARRRQPG